MGHITICFAYQPNWLGSWKFELEISRVASTRQIIIPSEVHD